MKTAGRSCRQPFDGISSGETFSPAQPPTMSFRTLPALNTGTVEAGISMGSLVLGFRPTRAARFFTSNEPKPTSWTFSPSFKASVIGCRVAVMTGSASFF